MALPGWLDDSRNPTLWITTIYPLLIFVLAYACHFRMQALIESFPLPPDDSADTKEIENELLEAGDASSADYDMVADDATITTGHADKPRSSAEAPDPRVASKRNASTTPQQMTKRPSLRTKYIQGFLIYGLQVLLTQRLGVLAISRAHESHSLVAKLIGSLVLSFAAFWVLMSSGNLDMSRGVILRGYRSPGRSQNICDQSDPWSIFGTVLLLTLVVPCFRLVLSFIWL
ncbi:uncharacterized protein Z519_06379 [Cladophialophora bantiana CBS 173.52]|uniref:Uncharacterized protein n=1 Tax=Cladophialophora bantiana (strain ATCC 10958 / CBS 173.52 / CDC B-1940 / NIH 8579) TaxID=1442370 RepID=A0A0D2G1E4_CLAB1|nr:uncharacterized protein Z519_06379 [Cladophialophora bantiana CBS 173.52]KIW92532.1 hypothetical protein Z519_06379 [Cladophialophora bantiana CBS 173.52]